MTPMNQEIKTKWLAALRSGDYEQGDGCLKSSDPISYCCLGVLCDVIDPKGWNGIEYGGYVDLPPDEITEKAGLGMRSKPGYLFRWFGPVMILSQMNDSGSSFSEIADWIEANL